MLLMLHIVWTYFILKVLYRAILAGQVNIYDIDFLLLQLITTECLYQMEKDARSSSSEDFSDDNSKSGNSSASPATPTKRHPSATAPAASTQSINATATALKHNSK